MSDDQIFMRQALAIALKGRGKTAPNPCVGAVLVHKNAVVAQGFHEFFGGAHAERNALKAARENGINPKDCTLYVTLEPCNHHGKTPPCTEALLEAGIQEIVIGCLDPNPHVAGGGAQRLAAQGVHVRHGILEQECRDLIADFLLWQREERPFCTLKLASTLDGKIACRNGHSAWVSGEKAREQVHSLRGQSGAILIGGQTWRTDNPQLTCRTPDFDGAQPLAIILTSHLPENDSSFLLQNRAAETFFWTSDLQAKSVQAKRLRDRGVRVWDLPDTKNGLDLRPGLTRLFREHGCFFLLAEGGGGLAGSLCAQGLADELLLFMAPKILGDAEGLSSFSGRSVLSMAEAWNFRLLEHDLVGTDIRLRLR